MRRGSLPERSCVNASFFGAVSLSFLKGKSHTRVTFMRMQQRKRQKLAWAFYGCIFCAQLVSGVGTDLVAVTVLVPVTHLLRQESDHSWFCSPRKPCQSSVGHHVARYTFNNLAFSLFGFSALPCLPALAMFYLVATQMLTEMSPHPKRLSFFFYWSVG